jgi:hypothetical protein
VTFHNISESERKPRPRCGRVSRNIATATNPPRSVYDGQDRIGSIEQRGPHDFLARDRQGRPIGTYGSAAEAIEAIGRRA